MGSLSQYERYKSRIAKVEISKEYGLSELSIYLCHIANTQVKALVVIVFQ